MELRWLNRFGPRTLHEDGTITGQHEKVLQYRVPQLTIHEGGLSGMSDWQDVPTVSEDA